MFSISNTLRTAIVEYRTIKFKKQVMSPKCNRNTNTFTVKSIRTSLVAQTVKRLSTMRETRLRTLGWEDPLEKEMATHSSTLAWKIPWTGEPGRLQSIGSQRVRHD